MSQLNHPHIIAMVAVCLRPKPMLIMEYAELGSLYSAYPYTNVGVALKHSIALQVGVMCSCDVSCAHVIHLVLM